MAVLLQAIDLKTNFYTYEGVVHALDNFNLTIEHGETYGLVGESGCGKSVTVRSMMRIIQAPGKIESGKVLFHETPESPGVDLLAKSERAMEGVRGDKISMIFQEPNAALNPVLTIGEQVAESFLFHRKKQMCAKVIARLESGEHRLGPLRGSVKILYTLVARKPDAGLVKLLSRLPLIKHWDWLLKKEAIRRSIEVIGQLGIANPEEIVKRYPHNLSGGMKQRIVIAIALACQPTLLIADEATSNLDVTVQAQILELLGELKKNSISSILLITHDLGVVAETCDKVGVMYAGTLCETGTVDEIFNSPLHPYTRALLNSVPKLEQKGELQSIEGSVPNLVTPPPGCRFHPRCPYVMPVCSLVVPRLEETDKGRLVACHLYTEQDNS